MARLQTHRRTVKDGEVTYYFMEGRIGPGGSPILPLDRPGFSLVSRQVAPRQMAKVEIGPMEVLSKGEEWLAVSRSTGANYPTALLMIFPEGGPVHVTLRGRTMTARPDEFILLYPGIAYTVQTIPQSFITHRMLVHLTPLYVDQVWTAIAGPIPRPLPVFTTGTFPRSPLLNHLLRMAFEGGEGRRTASPWLATEGLVAQLVQWLCFSHPHDQATQPGGLILQPTQDPKVRQTITFLTEHLAQPMALERVAKEVGIHKNTLNRRFQKSLGLSVGEFLQRYRLDYAQRLLRTTDAPITEASLAVGMTPGYFFKMFKRVTGLSPARYRTLHRR